MHNIFFILLPTAEVALLIYLSLFNLHSSINTIVNDLHISQALNSHPLTLFPHPQASTLITSTFIYCHPFFLTSHTQTLFLDDVYQRTTLSPWVMHRAYRHSLGFDTHACYTRRKGTGENGKGLERWNMGKELKHT